MPSGAAGWITASALGPTRLGAVAGALAGLGAYGLLMLVFQRDQTSAAIGLLTRSIKSGRRSDKPVSAA